MVSLKILVSQSEFDQLQVNPISFPPYPSQVNKILENQVHQQLHHNWIRGLLVAHFFVPIQIKTYILLAHSYAFIRNHFISSFSSILGFGYGRKQEGVGALLIVISIVVKFTK
jgi:hypothetical protein